MADVNRNRTDSLGRRSPERVEHDFERDGDRNGPGVQRSEELKNAERLPRMGNEEDRPYNDKFGD